MSGIIHKITLLGRVFTIQTEVITGPERSVKQVVHRLAGCWRHWGGGMRRWLRGTPPIRRGRPGWCSGTGR